MAELICPYCGGPVPSTPIVGILSICPNQACLRTVAIDDGIRAAIGTDTTSLSPDDLTRLRAARKALRTA